MDRTALERAAHRLGIDLVYEDTWGQRHVASDAALAATLAALGIPAQDEAELAAALEREALQTWLQPVPPVLVIPEGTDWLRLNIPASKAGASVKLEIRWEPRWEQSEPEKEHHWFWLPELPELEKAEAGGQAFLAKRVPLPPLRPGYHGLTIYWMHEPELEVCGEARLIVHPRRVQAPERRMAGVALSLYGLRSARNWGCGDFTDLRAAVDVFAPAGAAFLALNPLHAIPNRQPYNTSPYLPECSLYRNFLYLDVERVPGYDPSDRPAAEIDALRSTTLVEYERVATVKRTALERAFRRFRLLDNAAAFEQYVAAEGQALEDYATYCALWASVHRSDDSVWLWTDWPEAYRNPRSAEVAAWAAAHRSEVEFHKFLQWQIDGQLAEVQAHARACGMPVGLYHDLALATDRFGADLWANRAFYATGARVGAPPDELAPGGQDWGFPPPNREAHRADGYQLFAKTIRNTARHGGALRIDHVMRFFRLFWIPEALTAADGVYVHDHVDNLLGVLALESAREKFFVIGEDLGTVPPGVREKLGDMGILGYRLLWFEKNGDGSFRLPQEYPEHAAVSTTTHDLPTLAGFFQGRDIEARKTAGLVDEAAYRDQWSSRNAEIGQLDAALARAGTPHDAIRFVLSAPSIVAILNQEDLTGETEQQNLPASTWQHPNWSRKMRVAVEDLAEIASQLRAKIEAAGR